jgi:hypothetical protein
MTSHGREKADEHQQRPDRHHPVDSPMACGSTLWTSASRLLHVIRRLVWDAAGVGSGADKIIVLLNGRAVMPVAVNPR